MQLLMIVHMNCNAGMYVELARICMSSLHHDSEVQPFPCNSSVQKQRSCKIIKWE